VKPKILIVDDDPFTVKLLEGLFRGKPGEVLFAYDGAEARRRFREADFNLVIMDQRLPDANGLDLIREMRLERPRQLAILITGYADVRDAVNAVREGLFDYLTKPFENLEELEAVIEKALEMDRAYREIDSLRESLDGREDGPVFIGRAPAVERILQQIKQVAPLDTTVLLEGESGTGKDLAAKIVHTLSPRSPGRFLEVNCGALPENLLESTLFGYEKGAFTGAAKTTPGCIEEADGGTLFLDEIADMSAKLQSSLLHTLQEHTFLRLGSTVSRSSDFRLICATNRQLSDEVRQGRFREDLFYRINVIALRMPPLRERREDIVLLAIHFLERFKAKFAKDVGPFSPDAIRLMESFSWPGNVRQLQHAVERIVALHGGGLIGAGDLEPIVQTSQSPGGGVRAFLSYEDERAEFERTYIEGLLDAANGNVSEAARLSGISRQNLYARMKRWNIVAKS
jgi:DNA-binding NtrC family response regulator